MAGKKKSDDMKSWYEWCFDHGPYKFLRLNSWSPHVDVEPPAGNMVEPPAGNMDVDIADQN